MELLNLTAVQLSAKIKAKEVTVAEALDAVLEQIEKLERDIHSYVTIDWERAKKSAEEVQKKINKGELNGLLAGVPIAVKDNICTKDLLTTCSSKMLENFLPSYSAQAVENLKKEGVVIIGKTNMDEFAMGSTTETSAFGVTKNPWNKEHVPGGSSGGSAAAVAAAQCYCALGSDTGGSIRQPASYCGIVGMKPTYGTVSRYGLIAYGSSLEQIGPLCKDVTDCAAVLEGITSYDKKDSTSILRKDREFIKDLKVSIKGWKIGIPKDYFGEGLSEEVRKAVLGAAKELEKRGARLEEFDLKHVSYAIPAYYILACAEASSNLGRFDGVKYEAYYLKALKVRALIKEELCKAFEKYDILLGPTTPNTAPKLGDSLSHPMNMYLGDIYTIALNLAGLPGISLPCGKDKGGLPIGLQLIGDCFMDKKVMQAAYAYEEERGRFIPCIDEKLESWHS